MKSIKELDVLVVDDEPELAELVALEFEAVGARVHTANNGLEAFEFAKNNKVDVIITDVRMPDCDGIELIEKIRAANLKVGVTMLMTGFADLTLEDAYAKGAAAVFGKPFNRRELIKAVSNVILPYSERWQGKDAAPVGAFILVKKLDDVDRSREIHRFNIGSGGFFVALEGNLPSLTDNVDFDIRFAKGQLSRVSGLGVVRWVRYAAEGALPRGVGIEINQVNGEKEREEFSLYLERLRPEAYIPKN